MSANDVRTHKQITRRGAVAVEFALILPLFFGLLMGVLELGRALEVSHTLTTAAREGGRLGSMDRQGILLPGQSGNQKIEADIRAFLNAAGLPGSTAVVKVVDPDDETVTFDIDDPDNELELFRVIVRLDFDNGISYIPPTFMQGKQLEGSVVFRNGRTSFASGG